MLLLRHNSSLPDLDASSFRLRSSSYPSYNTIQSKQFTSSPPEEILSNYVHTTPPSQPHFSMYSSSQDQREESLVDPWLPTPDPGDSADVSQPADDSSSLTGPNTISRSTYSSPPHQEVSTSAPFNDPSRHARFHQTPSGSPPTRHLFHSQQQQQQQQHSVSLNRHLSEPNIRSVINQPSSHYSLSSVTDQRLQQQQQQQQQRRQQQNQSFQHGVTSTVLPSPSSAVFSVDRRPSTAGSATSSGWETTTRDIRVQEVTGVTQTQTQTQDLPPITAGDHINSPVERYPPAFSNPFDDNVADARPRSSGFLGNDPLLHPGSQQQQNRLLHSPGSSSLVPIARPLAPEEENDTAPPDPSVSKTYSFVSLPGNAVRKRPRRRYDEIERLYHCSWAGCTKSYGTLNHLNAHIVMQRHGNKRTPAEFKELRKQWRKAKKDESERMARLERTEERYIMRTEHAALQYSSQPYERSHRSFSYGRQQLYGPGVPGPEMDHQLTVGDTTRYPVSADASSMRPQPLQPQYGYPISGAGHPLYPVAPTTPISPTWPEQPTQYEGNTPPQHGPVPGHPHLPAHSVYDYERERQPQPWTSSAHAASSRPVSSYEVSTSYAQPHTQQRVNTLPPDSTLLTPLPGYQPSAVLEPEFEEDYDSKQQFWSEQQH
ncbi:hypothetical protein B0F90DRAFT_1695775 [Multifurca ochricompacta]|uniref:C2H2-type domain-containing protein n=1 Tax=Multifurca ochricompacta TaxID=376703 RepID=A0AAD4M9H4_9AGAM|nr:hypothetical protein B0F90DRAFT_1695775 [Multifurca ochricompacta]